MATDGDKIYVGGMTDGKLGSYDYGTQSEFWMSHYDSQGNRVWIKQYSPNVTDINLVGVGAGNEMAFISGSLTSGNGFYGGYHADGTGASWEATASQPAAAWLCGTQSSTKTVRPGLPASPTTTFTARAPRAVTTASSGVMI